MNKILLLLVITILFSYGCNQTDNNQEQPQSGEETSQNNDSGTQIERQKPESDSKVVARVNGVPIYEDEIKNKDINTLVTEEILYQEGLRRGLDKKYHDKVMDYQKSLIVKDIESGILKDLPPEKPVYNQDIQDYYEKHKDNYTRAKIKEINFKDKEQGEEIEKMAAEGMNLEDIADKLGSDVTVNDLGYNRTMARRFETKEEGSVTEVIEKRDGTYSILKIVEVSEIPLDYAGRAIRARLETKGHVHAINESARKIAEENNMKIEILGR